jgi:pimeloyl-ACP methyl ester carboxylesterase
MPKGKGRSSMKVSVEFDSESKNIQGKFYSAKGEPHPPTVLLLQGFPGNEDDVLELGQRMSQQGINTLTFNYRGTHQSEGTFSFGNTQKDIKAAFEYLHQKEVVQKFRIDTSRLILGGSSYGGGMALAYAASHPEVKRIFSIAGWDYGEFAREYMRNADFSDMIDTMSEELKFPTGHVHYISERPINELLQDPDPYDLRLNATALAERDLLLIGGWDDSEATIEHHLLPLYRALVKAEARARIVAFPDNHAFRKSRDEIARTVIGWVKSV